MDFSKLPKLSKTDTPPNAEPPQQESALWCHCGAPVQAGARFCPSCGRSFGNTLDYRAGGVMNDEIHPGEIWIAGFLGAIFMLLGWSFAKWSICKMTGQPFHTKVDWTSGPLEGTEVAYFDLQGMSAWTDAGVFLFGLALVFEAIVLLMILKKIAPAFFLWIGILICVAAFAINAFITVKLFGTNVMPILSLLAMAFTGFTLFRLWQLRDQVKPRQKVAAISA